MLVVLIVKSDFPETPLAALQGFAGIFDMRGAVGFDLPAVPQITLVLLQQFCRTCDKNLVGGLLLTSDL